MNMRLHQKKTTLALVLAGMLSIGAAQAEQYDPPVAIATLACPAGSTGYGNARFQVFPYLATGVWRATIWCSSAGSGRRGHYEPGAAGVFGTWNYAGGLFGAGWPPPTSYGNQYQSLDIDLDGDLDVFRIVETSANTWTLYVSRTL